MALINANLSFTISYGRFDESVQRPKNVTAAEECDWCRSTIYVQPDAVKNFVCQKNYYPDGPPIGGYLVAYGIIYNTRANFTTLALTNYTELLLLKKSDKLNLINSRNSAFSAPGNTPRGMMCMCYGKN